MWPTKKNFSTAQSTMEVSQRCDWSVLAAQSEKKKEKTTECWRPPWHSRNLKILQERIICTEQAYLKNRTSFVLTDCSFQSNFRQGDTRGGKQLNINLIIPPCHRGFIDTWGIKKWQRCRDGGCNGTKICQVETWMNAMVSRAGCK